MTLTQTEREILEHRLEIGDCIAECFTDTFDDEPACQWTVEEIMAECDAMLSALPSIPDRPSALQTAILINCCDASTFITIADEEYDAGGISRGKLLAYKKAAKSLGEKLTRLIGRDVSVCMI